MRIERPSVLTQSSAIVAIGTSLEENRQFHFLAIGGHEGPIKLYQRNTAPQSSKSPFSLHSTLQGHVKSVNALSFGFGRSGDVLASAGSDGTVRLWKSNTCQATLRGHRLDVTDVCWQTDSKLVSCGLDGYLIFWDAETGDKISSVLGEGGGWLKGVGLDTAGWTSARTTGRLEHPAIGLYTDGRILPPNGKPKNLRKDERNFQDTPREVAYSRRPTSCDSAVVLPYGQRGKRHFPVVVSGEQTLLLGHKTRVTNVAFSPWEYEFTESLLSVPQDINEGSLLAVVSQDGTLSVWLNAKRALFVLSGLVDACSVITDIAWHAHGIFLAASDGSVTAVDFPEIFSRSRLRSFYRPKEAPIKVARNLAPASVSGQVEQFSASGKRRVVPTMLLTTVKKQKPNFPQKLYSNSWEAENTDSGWTLTSGDQCSTSGPGGIYLMASSDTHAFLCVEEFVNEASDFSIVVRTENFSTEWLGDGKVALVTTISSSLVVFVFESGSVAVLDTDNSPQGSFKITHTARLPHGDKVISAEIRSGALHLNLMTGRVIRWDSQISGFVIVRLSTNNI